MQVQSLLSYALSTTKNEPRQLAKYFAYNAHTFFRSNELHEPRQLATTSQIMQVYTLSHVLNITQQAKTIGHSKFTLSHALKLNNIL